MRPEDLALLRSVQAEVEQEEALQKQSARYRNSEQKLFESVVSRVEHVISELLQNADDAGASKVRINFPGDVLTFQHDGKDFSDEQFRSICSFAVSSKRTFKTTGFRGIGFKSTFSLGDTVYLITPSFQVKFERARFTYPIELTNGRAEPGWPITIRVPVNERSRRELESSLNAWRTAPCSLLFFNNLKGGVIIDSEHFMVSRAKQGASLNTITKNGQQIWEGHLVAETNIKLPAEAREEIAMLRGASTESETDATTQLDILIGKNEAGRIYSVLPTSGERRLQTPFAVNSCFVLTPSRDGIKSPSQSPTNRFLFAEAGRVVAKKLLTELERAEEFSDDLLRAYASLPLDGRLDKPDAETEASTELRAACLDQLKASHWVLTADFKVACPGTVKLVRLPSALAAVWQPETLRTIFAPDAYIVHPKMPEVVLKWLQDKGHLTQLAKDDLLRALTKPKIPKPESQQQLFSLWTWVSGAIILHSYQIESQTSAWSALNILPAEGEASLRSLDDVFNFSKDTSDVFTSGGVTLSGLGLYRLDPDFVAADDLKLKNPPQVWWTLMDSPVAAITKEISLANMLATVAGRIAERHDGGSPYKDVLRAIWRIYEEFGIPLDKDLPVLRANGEAVSVSKRQLILRTASLDITHYIPADAIAQYSLCHDLYPDDEQEKEGFCKWLLKGGSALLFPRPVQSRACPGDNYQAQAIAKRLGGNLIGAKSGTYAYEDYEWPKIFMDFWAAKSHEIPDLFEKVAKHAIEHHRDFLGQNRYTIFQRNYGGYWTKIDSQPPIPSGWARYFREKPCVRSQSGELRRPVELYITKPSTLSLINAGELTVSADQQEAYGEDVLVLMGCRHALPSLAEVSRLIFAELDSETPRPNRVHWLLRAANEVFRSSTDEDEKGKLLRFLADRPSIPSLTGSLERPDDLVQDAGEDAKVRVVVPDLRGSAIIAALGVRQSPSRESDIAWLDNEIETGVTLPREKLRKLRKLLAQPSSVSEHLWGQRKWLALDGSVRSLDQLAFWHADLKELPRENITTPRLLELTADFGVIAPLPQELRCFSKPSLLSCLQSELHLIEHGKDFDCGWLSAIAQVLWTEAEKAGDDQSTLEKISLQWRNARVVLEPSLSIRFTSNGVVIAEGIKVDAGWAAEDRLAIRAADEDEICELTDEIAHRLREPIAAVRTKTGSKLAAWIARREDQVTKLGTKTLEVPCLRPWPSADSKQVDLDSTTKETESAKADPKDDPGATRPPTNPSDESDATEVEKSNRKRDGSGTDDAQTRQGVRSGRHQGVGGAEDGTPAHNAADDDDIDEDDNDEDDNDDDDGGDDGGDDRLPRRLRGHRSYGKGVDAREKHAASKSPRAREGGSPPAQSPERMRSYVEHSLNRRERERQRSEALKAGDAAEEIVVGWERKAGREAKRIGGNNPGYDIVSKTKDGAETRYIEVKSIAGAWGGTGVRLTPTQFVHAEELGDRYWLYVVEDAKTTSPLIHPIQNPAAHISAFCFDCGWREIAELGTATKPPSTFAPKIGDTVLFDDQEVIVEKLETRGAFLLITFKLNGRIYRKMNTVLSPKE